MKTERRPKYGITIFKNGFEVRRRGRRITYLQDPDERWQMSFYYARIANFTVKEKSHFTNTIERVGLTYTIKRVIVSKEAMEDIAIGMMGYLKHVDNKQINLYP